MLSLEESPQLPHGYTACSMMALQPEIWFKIMDPLVDEYNKIKTGNINGEVMQKLAAESRKFIIRMTLNTFILLAVSMMMERQLII